jgi:hypothetical protein
MHPDGEVGTRFVGFISFILDRCARAGEIFVDERPGVLRGRLGPPCQAVGTLTRVNAEMPASDDVNQVLFG